MAHVIRLYVEKKPGFDIEAKGMFQQLSRHLNLKSLSGLRLFCRYDIQGLEGEDYQRAKSTVFSEPNADWVYEENLPDLPGYTVFGTEYLPGQYDQRADSAAQCAQLLTTRERPQVRSAQIIALKGDLSDAELAAIKAYCINPVEAREASLEKPETLDMQLEVPADVARIEGFCQMDSAQLRAYHESMGFAMHLDDLAFCQQHFQKIGRDPSITEIKVIDTYWSDHCRHTTFSTILSEIQVQPGPLSHAIEQALTEYLSARREVYADRKKDITLMDMATIGTKLLKKRGLVTDLDESEEINACSIEVPVDVDGQIETYLVQFKNETHNHPTEIEPFGGAATCLGGAIRDPLSGRSYVYQAMRVTGAADPRTPFDQTIQGKLPQSRITTGAARGYSSYGNQIGLATGQVVELYDEDYVAKRLEIGAVIGASPKKNVKRIAPAPGDVIVLLGGRTGRDGCGGATGSSRAHTVSSIETCSAEVQKGNPPTERKIQRLFRDPAVSTLIKKCNDFGAGGVCVAIGELADGLLIDLDRVPKKYEGLDGTELAISESQERMAVVLDPKDADAFIAAANRENLEAVVVATVTDTNHLIMQWRGNVIVDLDRDFLNTNGVTQSASVWIQTPKESDAYRTRLPEECRGDFSSAYLQNLSRLNVASQHGLCEMFDSSIGASTVLMPFGGKTQLTPEQAMVAKIPLLQGQTDTATAMSYGFIPSYSKWSPFYGSVFAVVESLSKIAAVGADPLKSRLTLQEYFCKLGQDEKRWGLPASALLGALTAQLHLGTPAIGGKDSMSGSFGEMDVPPTLVCFAVSTLKASDAVGSAYQKAGSCILHLPVPMEGALPDFDKLKALYHTVYAAAQQKKILSASVVKEGGVAACIAKSCFGNWLGFAFEKPFSNEQLFCPASGDLIVEIDEKDLPAFGPDALLLGRTISQPEIRMEQASISLEQALSAWKEPLSSVFPTETDFAPQMCDADRLYSKKAPAILTRGIARPKVVLPVFPGTNCEVDSARAFEQAGAIAETIVLNNLSPVGIEQSIRRLAKSLSSAQILMIPGGFSGGDEPDGSGKFIATTLRNPRVMDAVHRLLDQQDGLVLGICNGFQALIKTGLLPYGRIRQIDEDSPTLTFNSLGRHISRFADTRITSVKSPWLSSFVPGEVISVPLSHGEGRFVASPEMLDSLFENGQIATQYVDPSGSPSADIRYNPNGSACAIEGITSPDGRILGKMGHTERLGKDLAKNIPGNHCMDLFANGVKYFQ